MIRGKESDDGNGQFEAGNPPGHWFKIMSHDC